MSAEALAVFLAGIVAPFVVEFLKRGNLTGRIALWLAFGTSVVLAFMALLVTGGFDVGAIMADPTQLVGAVGIVFSLATLVYKQIVL